jgi:hypothetical protein
MADAQVAWRFRPGRLPDGATGRHYPAVIRGNHRCDAILANQFPIGASAGRLASRRRRRQQPERAGVCHERSSGRAHRQISECSNHRQPSSERSPIGPNTRQSKGAGLTRNQHETTRFTTRLNLQNLASAEIRLRLPNGKAGDIGVASPRNQFSRRVFSCVFAVRPRGGRTGGRVSCPYDRSRLQRSPVRCVSSNRIKEPRRIRSQFITRRRGGGSQ